MALIAILGATACGSGNDGYYELGNGDNQAPLAAIESIDTGEHLDALGGQGVGVFVEYDAGGNWRVFATCDTSVPNQGGYACNWDLVASVPQATGLTITDETDLETDDAVYRVDPVSVRFVWNTDTDIDSVRFSAEAGEEMSLDVRLDGVEDPSFVNWVSNQTVQQGATDPADFAPTSP